MNKIDEDFLKSFIKDSNSNDLFELKEMIELELDNRDAQAEFRERDADEDYYYEQKYGGGKDDSKRILPK